MDEEMERVQILESMMVRVEEVRGKQQMVCKILRELDGDDGDDSICLGGERPPSSMQGEAHVQTVPGTILKDAK